MLEDGGIFIFGPFRLVVARRELLADGKPVPLGGRAFEVLLALVRRPGKLVSRDDLVAAAWHGAVVEENTVQAQLSQLRRTLRDGKGEARYIETIARQGYCFVAPVVWQGAEDFASSEAPPRPAARRLAGGWSRRRIAVVLVLLLLIFGGVGLRWAIERRPPTPWSAEDRRLSFLLKPFKVAGDDPELRDYAEALMRSVAARMRYTDLSVQFAPPDVGPARDAKGPAGAKFIFEASVDVHDGVPRVTVVVRNATTGQVLRTEAIEDPPTESHVSSRLAVMMIVGVALRGGQIEELARSRALPEDQRDARDWVMLADEEPEGREGNARAIAQLEHARATAPDDFHVMGPYALALAVRANGGWSTDAAADLAVSQALAERTLVLTPRGAHALPALCLDLLTRGRWEDAIVAADRMLPISPHNTWALRTKALSLLALGRNREAEAVLAVWLPADAPYGEPDVFTAAGLIHFAGGRDEEAAHWLRNAILATSAEDLRQPAFAGIRLYLASAEAHLGHVEAAAQALRDFLTNVPEVHGIAEFRRWNDPIRFFLVAPERLAEGLRLAGMTE